MTTHSAHPGSATRPARHATFSVERVYEQPPARVFAAWADPATKARWFTEPGFRHELDFRPGGREITRGSRPGGPELTFASAYHDIVPDQRIVYSSVLSEGERVATVSITTVELVPEGEHTRLVLTEYGAFLDALEEPEWRERGTRAWMENLGAELGA
ncbi:MULTISPECIES: SRPBCC family protein [Streptomyces]|uniref:SRPBCC family protein n=1 Tax=Streptomyces TaxID=1883 RepID=UPI000CD4D3C9|nr:MULTISPECIES: SRPBCC family protein [Streptomyces]